jgi:hypothetical protein
MGKIVAVVSSQKENIAGGAPIFIADSKEACEKIAFSLEKIIDASAHLLPNGVMILVDHVSENN